MKKLILLSSVFFAALAATAQPVIDTVSLSPNYVNQNYYKLSNGAENVLSTSEWDLGFQTGIMTGGVWINNISAAVYTYLAGAANNTNFTATWDTAGFAASWQGLYNPQTTWDLGAFNTTGDGSQFDYGWGVYQARPTHNVLGDSLYLFVKGTTYKKLWIVAKLSLENKYVIRYANLDGSGDETDTLNFNSILSKNMGYFAFDNANVFGREPNIADWDLLFTRYNGALAPPFNKVTGVLSNPAIQVAEVNGVADVEAFEDTTGVTWSTDLNAIGDDWKTPPPPVWVIKDSLVYFVLRGAELWKLVFTGFGGQGNGNFIFTKELLSTAIGVNESPVTNAVIYPNPLTDGNQLTLVYSLANRASDAAYTVFDLAGKMVAREQINGETGLHTQAINTGNLAPGMYMVNLTVDNATQTLKLIVR
ncbi:MAG: T9SS type A sorting domain-containing protein [Sphingobacteriales bacterium JAD_PAG50586_3]|nr:MAG: T9SS type A sorting domain-containing protein [Sphingobacteriales bacterium JAD_PAG50586_3]